MASRPKMAMLFFPLSLFIYLGKEVYHIKKPCEPHERLYFTRNQIRMQCAIRGGEESGRNEAIHTNLVLETTGFFKGELHIAK